MDAIAHPRAAVPQPPGFLATAWAVFIGFVLAAFSIAVVGIAAIALGVAGRDSITHERPAAIDWPFAHDGAWSIATDAIVTAGILLACAFSVSHRVSQRYGAPVSIWRTFAVVVFTGYAPYVAYRGLIPAHFLFALLATTFLIRHFAVGVPPLELSHRIRVAVAAAAVGLVAVSAAYGATHPLRYSSYVSGVATDWQQHRVVFEAKSERTVRYTFMLENFSLSTATLLEISGQSSPPMLRVVDAARGIVFPHETPIPVRGVSLGYEDSRTVTLLLHLNGCAGAWGTFTMDRVDVRYRLAGMTLSQPVFLAIRPTVVCR